ncbi:MAG: leucine-rich repeat protein [Lachnospiraceae bacterium]|nr:leucine-rich repeat protein [Lachnospiraceae bacterium]
MKSVELPKSAVTIGDCAFASLGKIETITIPSKVKEIEGRAFAGSRNLKKIVIESKKITAIGRNAFDLLKNTDIYVPKKKYSEYKKLIRNSFTNKNCFKKIRIIKY